LDACKDRKIVCWCRTQAPSYNAQGVVYGRVNEAGVSSAAPDRRVVQYFVVGWTRAKVALRNVLAPVQHPSQRQQIASRVQSVM